MKKIITFITGLAAVCALTACSADGKGKEVKAEEFKEQAEKIEEHQYNEATVKYTYASEFKIPNMALEDESDETEPSKEEKKGETVFTFKDGEWTTTDEEADNIFYGMVGVTLKDADLDLDSLTASVETMSKEYGIDSVVKYYVNPLGIEVSAKGDMKEDDANGSVDIYEYIAFDKYGYVNKLDAKMDIKSVSKIGEETYEMKMFTEVHATVSYK